ncbi:MAG: Holliday junction branch migration protein RuvA [Chlamydiales bacterium]|nr:Holliday junction branch migration protein RuvA [Chlamydiales bacterium]
MFEFIQGILEEATPSYAILQVHGIGYKLSTPANLLQKLPSTGEKICLYTSFVIRENSQALYGFFTKQERDLFEKLINISGIGPKTALSLIGHLDVIDLVSCIRQNNLSALCRVPGIGKKTAERIILETKDKLLKLSQEVSSSSFPMRIEQDAINALIHLGYSSVIAEKAIQHCLKEIKEPLDLAVLITKALERCS